MSQIEVPKITALVAIGGDDDSIKISKIVAYAILQPGGDIITSSQQAHVYSQPIVEAD